MNHPITNHLIALFNRESFIYKQINHTIRNKIEKNIEYYGPFAAAFGQIIQTYPKNDAIPPGGLTLFRGIGPFNPAQGGQIRWNSIDVGQDIILQGFTSTSSYLKVALDNMNK